MGNFKDLTGQNFGELVALERDYEVQNQKNSKDVFWKCLCSCGNIKSIRAGDLKRIKRNKSAGTCGNSIHKIGKNNPQFKDETGKKYHKLTVLGIDKNNIFGYQNTKWICQCDCGSVISVYGSNLRSGRQKSCGCIISKGEYLISKLLLENNILFKKQFSFDECLSSSGNKLKFDFAVFENEKINFLIEFDGEQHFKIVEAFGGEKDFLKRQENDKIKNEYCQKNNIKLVRISNIKDIVLENIIS